MLCALHRIHRYGVNVLYDDDLDIGLFLNTVYANGLHWADLIAQHNESRFITVRLLALALTSYHGTFDIRLLMLASALTVAFTGVMLARLARNSFGNTFSAWIIAILANMLLFLPSQWQNFLWGVQWIVFVPPAALAVGLVSLEEIVPLWFGWPIAMLAAMFANYTNSNGFILWGLLLPSLVLRRSRCRRRAALSWIVVAALSIAYYFHHYSHPDGLPTYDFAITNPGQSITFLLAFLGNGLRCTANVSVAMCIGLGVTVSCVFALLILWREGDEIILRKSLPWIILAMYSILSGGLATAGRVGLGLSGAIPPRYPTFTIPLYIAVIALWGLATEALVQRRQTRPALTMVPAIAVVVSILLLSFRSTRFISGEMKNYYAARLTALALVQWNEIATDPTSMAKAIFPSPESAREILSQLRDNRFLPGNLFIHPSEVSSIFDGSNTSHRGQFESLTHEGDLWVATGWAELPGGNRAADAIVFTVHGEHGVNQVIAITGDVRRSRSGPGRPVNNGWLCRIRDTLIPPGNMISAWAYDVTLKKAYALPDAYR